MPSASDPLRRPPAGEGEAPAPGPGAEAAAVRRPLLRTGLLSLRKNEGGIGLAQVFDVFLFVLEGSVQPRAVGWFALGFVTH